MAKDTELPTGKLLFSGVLNAVRVRVVKRGDAYPALRTRSRRRGWRRSCGRCCCCTRCCSRCRCRCCGSCWRGRWGCAPNLEVIGLAAVVVEVAISTDPNFVLSTWIWRVIVSESGEATGSCLQDRRELITLNEFTAGNSNRSWIALAQNRLPTGVGHLHAVTAIRETGGTRMRRATIDVNILLIIIDVYVHARAGAVTGKDGTRNRRSRTKRGTQCQNRDQGDPYTFFIFLHL